VNSLKNYQKFWREYLVGALVLANIFVWSALYQKQPSDILSVYFLNVGQGDAILIDSPRHARILIDGGKNRQILAELGKILSFGDKNIDVVIATHPDADHIGGLPEVVSRYDVGLFLEPGVESENSINQELLERLEAKNVPQILARRGMVINLGDEVRLVILFPNQDVSRWETNRASVVAKLIYKDSSFLLTGDSPLAIESVLVSLNPEILNSNVLKAGHHGSRTSTSQLYVETISPEYVVISAGKGNSYGHPHQEVLDILEKVSTQVVSTINRGTIKFETDGKILKLK
jgi:competence protein ComEC